MVKVQEPSTFLTSVFNGNSEDERAKKEARDFCKKLLGQIVFLYFLQKKGWLGASNTDYQDGDKNFIQNFFKQAGENDTFYPVWLSKLFYDTLNEKRNEDDFTLPNGETVKIPYLNGGLFEKENNKYDFLVFPADLFTSLFEFFNRFNFTIYENSPEEHTIAVDPEMLGHIFENLLEDNKDKGAFYTPKEIVQYMTQESLIEYLATHIGQHEKEGISTFVKQKNKELLSDKVLKQIDRLLDDVKVCDPAIGSGAFPMGLLQEIFMLKERIAFDLGFSVWSPATVKENIIQNSIYGVDIEKGAVDIAQLRFWLSLVVDEDKPKPLPNLAYKIVVGNSLVSKFGDEIIEIDWSTDTTKGGLFGQELITEKIVLLKKISETQKKFFSANNKEKDKLKKQIRKLKLDILGNQLAYMIETKGTTLDSNAAKKPSKKQTEAWLETEGWKRAIKEINTLKKNDKPFEHFDWKLDFPEILNPLVNENAGFDIVIANPPYVGVKGNTETFKVIKKGKYSKYFKGRAELFYFFMHLAIDLSKEKGVSTFITTNYFITSTDGSEIRKRLFNETTPIALYNFNELKLFSSALGQHNMITMFEKGIDTSKKVSTFYTIEKGQGTPTLLNSIFSKQSAKTEYYSLLSSDIYEGEEKYIRTRGKSGGNNNLKFIFSAFEDLPKLGEICYVKQGLRTGIDKISNTHINKFNYQGQKGEGVFIISQKELFSLGYNECNEIVKPLYKNSDITNYFSEDSTNQFLLYIDKDISEDYLKNNFPTIYSHLLKYKELILLIRGNNNENSKNWFRLDRSRENFIFKNEKICVPQRSRSNVFGLSFDDWYASADVYFIKTKDKSYNLKYLTAILNSKLYYLWFYYKGKRKGEMLELYQKPLSETPVINSQNIVPFVALVDYILFLKSNKNILSHTDNDSISSHIESILDMMVYELYFTEHMMEKGINVLEFIKPKPLTENTNNEQKAEIIKNFYEWYQEPENAVRQRMLLIETRSPNILAVINSAAQ